jgi:hypothetical protein
MGNQQFYTKLRIIEFKVLTQIQIANLVYHGFLEGRSSNDEAERKQAFYFDLFHALMGKVIINSAPSPGVFRILMLP